MFTLLFSHVIHFSHMISTHESFDLEYDSFKWFIFYTRLLLTIHAFSHNTFKWLIYFHTLFFIYIYMIHLFSYMMFTHNWLICLHMIICLRMIHFISRCDSFKWFLSSHGSFTFFYKKKKKHGCFYFCTWFVLRIRLFSYVILSNDSFVFTCNLHVWYEWIMKINESHGKMNESCKKSCKKFLKNQWIVKKMQSQSKACIKNKFSYIFVKITHFPKLTHTRLTNVWFFQTIHLYSYAISFYIQY